MAAIALLGKDGADIAIEVRQVVGSRELSRGRQCADGSERQLRDKPVLPHVSKRPRAPGICAENGRRREPMAAGQTGRRIASTAIIIAGRTNDKAVGTGRTPANAAANR